MTDAMIVTKNLFVTLPSQAGAVNIIRGMDLSISSGETVGLIGPSGSGKSTLLMVLAGLEPASQGQVIVSGHDYANMDEDALSRFRRSSVGIVFQSFHLVPTMTAVENVALPLELAGVASAFEKAEAMLEEVGLAHRLAHYPAQMSGGEQQRTALARTSSICKYNIGTELRMAFGAALREAVGADPDRFDRVQILKETHDPVVVATRRVLAALKPV